MVLRLPASPVRPLLRKMIAAGLKAADPYRAILHTISLTGSSLQVGRRVYDVTRYDRIVAVGAGKASALMALALEQVLGSRLQAGLVVVKHGHTAPTKRVAIVEAGHPVPNRAGLRAAAQLRTMVGALTARDLVIVLLSGGASSLLPAPVPGISLADKQKTTQLLLRSGATIQEVNAVRKHLSLLKGGGLASSTKARIVTLILSDVIGDDLSSIGSGPTAPDPTTYADAIRVLQRYKLWRRVPVTVRRHLLRGRRGDVPETLKAGSGRLRHVQHQIIGNNRAMLETVTGVARQAGLRTILFSTAMAGEAREAGERFAALARCAVRGTDGLRRPYCVVAGGETTVTVTGHGKGGRAQEFAVAAAIGIAGLPHVWIAALGTDGTDGPTDVAGAVVSGETAAKAQMKRISLDRALNRHETHRSLKALHAHIYTGPTGTNVNDLYLLLAL